MLYYPWCDEDIDLLAGHSTAVVASNESKYTLENVDAIDVDEDSRPEHAWCQIAQHSNTNTAQQGTPQDPQDDLVDNCCNRIPHPLGSKVQLITTCSVEAPMDRLSHLTSTNAMIFCCVL